MVLVVAIGWRSRRWRMISVPVALFVGVALTGAVLVHRGSRVGRRSGAAGHVGVDHVDRAGRGGGRAGMARRPLGHRGVSVVAVPLCVLCAALTVNMWVGCFPTVGTAWDRMTGAPLPGETDRATVAELQQQHRAPDWRTIVSVRIPDHASGFKHRDELVLLPPAWYTSTPPPPLPVVMMIGGEFGNPAAWLYAGDAKARSLTSRRGTAAMRRCWCSPIPAGPSAMTPSA